MLLLCVRVDVKEEEGGEEGGREGEGGGKRSIDVKLERQRQRSCSLPFTP